MRLAFLIAFALAWPIESNASDGRIEINQACALAGCFQGDSPGFPVTLSGGDSFVLTSNLDVSGATSAITTGSPGRVLDLNGFEIAGPGLCGAAISGTTQLLVGVSCSGHAPLTAGVVGLDAVSNGSIRGFAEGIRQSAAPSFRVERVRLWQNLVGINATDRRLLLTDSLISTNDSDGVAGQATGSNYTIRSCVFERNGTRGLYLANGVVSESIFVQNAEALRSNVGGTALAVNNSFQRNEIGISGSDAAYRSNVFDSNTTDAGGRNLGDNVCDGNVCP
jgi:hypothetical protein